MNRPGWATGAVRSTRLLQVLNIAALALAYAALFAHAGISATYRLALLGGGALVCLAALLTFVGAARERSLGSPSAPALRAGFAVAPWALLTAVIVVRGLWWTQRPSALR